MQLWRVASVLASAVDNLPAHTARVWTAVWRRYASYPPLPGADAVAVDKCKHLPTAPLPHYFL